MAFGRQTTPEPALRRGRRASGRPAETRFSAGESAGQLLDAIAQARWARPDHSATEARRVSIQPREDRDELLVVDGLIQSGLLLKQRTWRGLNHGFPGNKDCAIGAGPGSSEKRTGGGVKPRPAARPTGNQPPSESIDWARAQQFLNGEKAGEKLSAQEQAYLDHTKAVRQQTHGRGVWGCIAGSTGYAVG